MNKLLIEKLYKTLSNEVNLVNLKLQSDIAPDVILLQNVFEYILNAGGKRLRPLLTLAISKMICHHQVNGASICLAAAVELIHTATLLHDDVIDNAVTRRNIETVNTVWNNKTSILVGDNMFSKAFQLIVQSNKIKAFKELADASSIISAAEVWQIQLLNKIDITIDDYIRLITNKTAVLFGAACVVGAIACDGTNEVTSYAKDFGTNFGIYYQICDDLLDYFGEEKSIGKETFQDIREGKVTLPLIFLLNHLKIINDTENINFLKKSLGSNEIDKRKIYDLFEFIDIKSEVENFANKYLNAAKQSLEKIPTKQDNIKDLLLSI
jgi:octaprenyl-diphosphate synthase